MFNDLPAIKQDSTDYKNVNLKGLLKKHYFGQNRPTGMLLI